MSDTRRIPLDDGQAWFDPRKALAWEEESRWDGSNRISRATGSQWAHEKLFLTRSGRWVLHHWSQWQGTGESYETLTREEAARWLVSQEYGREHLVSGDGEPEPSAEQRAEMEQVAPLLEGAEV